MLGRLSTDLNHHVISSFSNQLISFEGMKYWKSTGDCSEISRSGSAECFSLSSIFPFMLKLHGEVKH